MKGIKMKRKLEILSPAGSYETMLAAMNAGCDAVYIGGSSFGARAYANNFDEDTLLRAIDEAHIRDKNLYLTVNTLVKEEELRDKLYSYLQRFYQQGLNAIIVQDVGVMEFVHKHFPNIQIHASTQATLTMAEGANFLKEKGVTRIVTSRELSLKEIKKIRDNTDMEIETFVHGALCYCYSGQCLMSSMIGGRSGNRGRCAQPCRMPYQFYTEDGKVSKDSEKYLLSPKDINTLTLIPDLVDAGIDSFKIEGRMKRAEYSAGVTSLYRKCIDLYLEKGRDSYDSYLQSKEHQQDMMDLQDLYNRGGFSQGYGKTYHGKKMMSLTRPNHSGVLVGEVTSKQGNDISIRINQEVHGQDILEIRNLGEESGHEFTVKDTVNKGSILKTYVGKNPNSRDKGMGPKKIMVGAQVYRTKNNQLLNRIAKDYMENDAKLMISGHLLARLNQPLELHLCYKDYYITAYGQCVQEAQKQPMTEEKLRTSILKFGDTPYSLSNLTVDTEEDIFVPVAWLNELRRTAVERLQEAMTSSYYRELTKDIESKVPSQEETNQNSFDTKDDAVSFAWEKQKEVGHSMGMIASVQRSEQFEAVLEVPEVNQIYVEYHQFTLEDLISMGRKAMEAGRKYYLSLPHICRLSNYEQLKKDILSLYGENAITGYVVKNFEEVALIQEIHGKNSEKEIILNHNMYIYNREAKNFWREKGITEFTAALELNSRELEQVGIEDSNIMVYGYLPLMVSAQCLYESTDGCKRCKLGTPRIDYLLDRMDKKFYVQSNCVGCYNIIYNGQRLSLLRYKEEIQGMNPKNIRLDFVFEGYNEVSMVLDKYVKGFYEGTEGELEIEKLTAGHFKRGVE